MKVAILFLVVVAVATETIVDPSDCPDLVATLTNATTPCTAKYTAEDMQIAETVFAVADCVKMNLQNNPIFDSVKVACGDVDVPVDEDQLLCIKDAFEKMCTSPKRR